MCVIAVCFLTVSYSICTVLQRVAALASVCSVPWELCTEPGSRVFTSSTDPAMTASTPKLKFCWSSLGALPKPCPKYNNPVVRHSAGCQFPQHGPSSFYLIRANAANSGSDLHMLEQLSSHFDIYVVAQCCPFKTGKNTHGLNTALGGRDREMTAISNIYPASQCLSPQRITKWP